MEIYGRFVCLDISGEVCLRVWLSYEEGMVIL